MEESKSPTFTLRQAKSSGTGPVSASCIEREREWVKLPIIFYFYFLKKEQESKAAYKSLCCSFFGRKAKS